MCSLSSLQHRFRHQPPHNHYLPPSHLSRSAEYPCALTARQRDARDSFCNATCTSRRDRVAIVISEVESYERFTLLFLSVFYHPVEEGECLLRLHQGSSTASEFALEVRTIAASTGWNESALIIVFRSGLREEVQLELTCRDDNLSAQSDHGPSITPE